MRTIYPELVNHPASLDVFPPECATVACDHCGVPVQVPYDALFQFVLCGTCSQEPVIVASLLERDGRS